MKSRSLYVACASSSGRYLAFTGCIIFPCITVLVSVWKWEGIVMGGPGFISLKGCLSPGIFFSPLLWYLALPSFLGLVVIAFFLDLALSFPTAFSAFLKAVKSSSVILLMLTSLLWPFVLGCGLFVGVIVSWGKRVDNVLFFGNVTCGCGCGVEWVIVGRVCSCVSRN